MKYVVFALLSFAAYSGYCFLPAYTIESQFENLVSGMLEDGSHRLTDKAIRDKTLQAARSDDVPLEKDDIEIWRDEGEGERTIHVELALPVTISYLGSEREMVRPLHVSRTYAVDEAAEARRVAEHEERRRATREQRRVSRENAAEYFGKIKEKCVEGTSNDFVVTHVMITGRKGGVKTVDCSTAHRLSKEFGGR